MLATKSYCMRFVHDLGKTLEQVLRLYRVSIGDADEGVPQELRRAATRVSVERAPRKQAGPADAVVGSDDDGDDDDDAAPDTPMPIGGFSIEASSCQSCLGDPAINTTSKAWADCSSAVVDTGLEDMTPLKLWSMAMKQHQVLEDCEAICNLSLIHI